MSDDEQLSIDLYDLSDDLFAQVLATSRAEAVLSYIAYKLKIPITPEIVANVLCGGEYERG